ncbi:hypothetical protein VTO42DRAFT_1763 [Malbranchea cinnamomea]
MISAVTRPPPWGRGGAGFTAIPVLHLEEINRQACLFLKSSWRVLQTVVALRVRRNVHTPYAQATLRSRTRGIVSARTQTSADLTIFLVAFLSHLAKITSDAHPSCWPFHERKTRTASERRDSLCLMEITRRIGTILLCSSSHRCPPAESSFLSRWKFTLATPLAGCVTRVGSRVSISPAWQGPLFYRPTRREEPSSVCREGRRESCSQQTSRLPNR